MHYSFFFFFEFCNFTHLRNFLLNLGSFDITFFYPKKHIHKSTINIYLKLGVNQNPKGQNDFLQAFIEITIQKIFSKRWLSHFLFLTFPKIKFI